MTKRPTKFQKGQSGNPQGKPPGPNKLTMAVRQQIADTCDPVGFMASVMKGEAQPYGAGEDQQKHEPTLEQRLSAARSLANKLAPDAKDRPLSFRIGQIAGPPDALAAMARVVEEMGTGNLTASEAGSVMTVIGSYLGAWETNDLDRRLRALEDAAAGSEGVGAGR